jgi:Ca-activated chloride channel family protein
MSFLWPVFLWTLLLLPLLLLLFWLGSRRRQRTAAAFADPHLLPSLVKRPRWDRGRLLVALQLGALAALLLAAARPEAALPLPVNKAAVVIAFDASRSMLADDVDPTRLEQARAYAESFVRQAPLTTQIGLASFSDVASVLVPPTTDRAVLLEALASIEPARNTSLAEAVVTGVRMLPGREHLQPPEELTPPGFAPPPATEESEDVGDAPPPPGSILIFSDGVSNVSANPTLPEDVALDLAARFAADHEVRLYAVPIGREGGTVSRIDGEDFFIPFEPRTLERLADLGQGQYVFPVDDDALAVVFRELAQVIRWEPTEMEISSLLAALAVVVLLLAGAMSLRWQRRVP